jgi:hypothetical protein
MRKNLYLKTLAMVFKLLYFGVGFSSDNIKKPGAFPKNHKTNLFKKKHIFSGDGPGDFNNKIDEIFL